ncbi:unnamed protein product [Vitrella brassicaformis CCMP3155]|uniref:Dynein regulatory complex protein 9 n=1 Tax=Vitrella brassicaformis (strain CCMP3155) TaxID=1169540 RepID=A0A0G4EIY8_VITBC|nr:unnamed protein product [Vitrella brassicaformis CCMP3155]|mmetsp:Transcript_45787/g.113777  ORF Transcript_45787/g.113777 Transcript_45787/m.113777 type:complete len:415 (-) Transcript_45787:130-1374(-)|eukprot:CEL95986.1 unnamed protein product [Vitrella brassicaformis CCMP3155]
MATGAAPAGASPSLAGRLTPIESLRAQILIEEALSKLQLMSELQMSPTGTGPPANGTAGAGGASVRRDELSQFMGDEISRILTEQKALEKQYEELIVTRSQFARGLTTKDLFNKTQAQIQSVSQQLRESNKALCRSLKENPTAAGNVAKLLSERHRVVEWLEETKRDIMEECSFTSLVHKVETERKQQEMLNEVRKREREAAHAVAALEEELKKEQTEYEKETNAGTIEMNTLKEELNKVKTQSAIVLSFEEKQLDAQEQAALRMWNQTIKGLQETLERTKVAQARESASHNTAIAYLDFKSQTLQEDRHHWQEVFAKDIKEQEDLIARVQEDKEATAEALADLLERMKVEEAERKAKEDQAALEAFVAEEKTKQEDRELAAITTIQSAGRQFLKRLAEDIAFGGKKKAKKKKK